MKATVTTLLACLSATTAWTGNSGDDAQFLNPGITLHVAAYYLDAILADTIDSLDLVASTPEAKSGDWNGIKPYLKQLEPSLPGVYFFVLPDGNYYTVTKDFTNLNLRDRPYFESLFSGEPVKGFPMYSRSSGKKTALLAVPVAVDEKTAGGLGVSIFLDELNVKMNQALALPPDYTWYVLDSEGNTLLHKNSDFIFMNALQQAGGSLHEAASEAMKSETGTMEYEFGSGTRHAFYRKLPRMNWWMFLAKIDEVEMSASPKLKLSLDRFVPDLQSNLDQIDGSLANSIEAVEIDAGSENDMRKLLDAVLDENLNVFEAAYVDAAGYLRYIAPGDYRNFENTDIREQAHVSAMRNHPAPLFSSGFQAVEGFQAVVVSRPLYDSGKKFSGCVSVVLRPEVLIDALLKTAAIPEDCELWIMQPDGLIIYDQDKGEIGRMLFDDPLYADYGNLLELGRQIASSSSGKGSYIYLAPETQKKVIKNAIWQTIRLHGREWRVVLAYQPYE